MTQSLHTKPKPSIALPSSERASVVAQLALLLLQAAGMGAGDDDGEL